MCLTPTLKSNLCQVCRATSPFDDAFVVGWRQEGLKKLLDDYKFESRREASSALSRLLDSCIPQLPPDTQVIAIPTLRRHIRQRGYDHMKRIASDIATSRHLSVSRSLERVSAVVQHGATRQVRIKQAKGMFTIRETVTASPLLLIDDIYTTGSTISSAAALLKSKTDKPIYLAVIARQPVGEIEE